MKRLVLVASILGLSLVPSPAHAFGLGHFGFIRTGAPGVIRIAEFDGSNPVDSSIGTFLSPQFGKDGRVVASTSDGISMFRRFHGGAVGRKIPGTKPGDVFPALSVDAKRLVLFNPTDGLMLMNLGSTKRFQISTPGGVGNDPTPKFSRDGKYVYFADNQGEIERGNLAIGETLTTDIDDGCPCTQPDASPDGQLIAFKNNSNDIIVKPILPVRNTNITVLATAASWPIFSPGSRYMAYVDNGSGKITFQPADGSHSVVVTTPLLTGGTFDWRS